MLTQQRAVQGRAECACVQSQSGVVCRGQVIKGQEAVVRSRYDEDVHPGDHSSVWGSFWADGRWGYACCKSHLKNSLCMGDRIEQVAQQRSRQADAAEQSAAHSNAAVQDSSAEQNSASAANGASDAGVNSPRRTHLCLYLLVVMQLAG